MTNRRMVALGAVITLGVVACAVITVNVYFPEKDVKEAYKALEKELMNPGKGEPETPPKGKPESAPQGRIRFEWVASACAQEAGLADNIAQVIKKMPEVVNAYKEMGSRLPDIDKLRDSGAVGEGKDGLLGVRDEKLLPADKKQLMTAENDNRKTVMKGMARAIIRINRVPENDQNMKQVTPQAVEQFAALRRDSSKKGWWVQDPSGNWSRK